MFTILFLLFYQHFCYFININISKIQKIDYLFNRTFKKFYFFYLCVYWGRVVVLFITKDITSNRKPQFLTDLSNAAHLQLSLYNILYI